MSGGAKNGTSDDSEHTENADMKGGEKEGLLAEALSGDTSQAVARDTMAPGAKTTGEYTQVVDDPPVQEEGCNNSNRAIIDVPPAVDPEPPPMVVHSRHDDAQSSAETRQSRTSEAMVSPVRIRDPQSEPEPEPEPEPEQLVRAPVPPSDPRTATNPSMQGREEYLGSGDDGARGRERTDKSASRQT